jgi:hypothetical protein
MNKETPQKDETPAEPIEAGVPQQDDPETPEKDETPAQPIDITEVEDLSEDETQSVFNRLQDESPQQVEPQAPTSGVGNIEALKDES